MRSWIGKPASTPRSVAAAMAVRNRSMARGYSART
jgi:hypothetical protein